VARAADGEPEAQAPFDVGPFRVLERLGRGGMGIVYRAEDKRLARMVALKVLPRELEKDGERRQRLLREARSAAAVSHPNVATVYEVGEDAGRTYIAMELVGGQTLRQRLEAGRILGRDVVRIATGIARALARAHESGIVHRDLKPDNVMIDRDGEPKVLDFGLAKLRDEALAAEGEQASTATALTREGAVLGTPGYMAPEQLLGRPVDARADVFAFGVVLYEMATGVRPFRGRSTMEVAIQIERDEPERPSKVEPRVDRQLERVIERCLAKKPESRFASGKELLEALAAIDASSVRTSMRLPSPRALLAVALGAVVLAAAATGVVTLARRAAPAASAQAASAPAEAGAPWWEEPVITTSPEARAAYVEALKSLRDGTGRANIGYRRAIELDPQFAAARVRLLQSIGCVGPERANYTAALAGRDRLNQRDRDLLDVLEPFCQHDPPDQLETSRRAIALVERYPDDVLAQWAGLGIPSLRKRAFDRIIARDPGAANAYASLAGSEEDPHVAESLYEKCLELSPAANNCQYSLVRLLTQGSDCARLEREARRATLMGNEYQSPWIALADALEAEGKPVDAIREILRQAASKKPSPEDYLDVDGAFVHVLAGDFVAARSAADEIERAADATTKEGPHALAASVVAQIALETGDLERARLVASRFFARRSGWEPDPRFEGATAILAGAIARSGGAYVREGERIRRERFAALAAPPEIAWYTWATIWSGEMGTREEAEHALAQMPEAGGPQRFGGAASSPLGHVYLLAGRLDDAIAWLQPAAASCDVLTEAVDAVHAHLWLGEAREQKGDTAGACTEYAAVLARWGSAKPRSVSADEARAHQRSLGCAPTR
jgi:serine/threonine-protein kinase